MQDYHIIEFKRTKAEAQKVFYNRYFKKQFISNVIRLIAIIPVAILLSIIFAVMTEMGFNLDQKYTNLIVVVWSLAIIFPFAKPSITLYQQYKNQFSKIFDSNEEFKIIFEFNEKEFKYKNDIFKYSTTWDNTEKFKFDDKYVTFQTVSPFVKFWIPTELFSQEGIEIIKNSIT